MTTVILIAAVLGLAWSNGANDNFKGVATLYGSGAASYRTALIWATVATLAGSLLSITAASELVKAFSGNGLVPPDLVPSPALLPAVGFAGAATIFLATMLGIPTSTTHALTGGLVGAGLVATSGGPVGVNWATLGERFAQPLLVSPVLAIAGAAMLYVIVRSVRLAMGVARQTCVCIGRRSRRYVPVTVEGDGVATIAATTQTDHPTIAVGSVSDCVERYDGRMLSVDAQSAVDVVHYMSGASVCFVRAVNDTPKIAALLLAGGGFVFSWQLGVVAAVMVFGGLLNSRRVAQTMSRRITDLNHGQGLTANLVTSGLVLGASYLGVPVSTTHVACGSIFGIGLVSGRRHWGTILQILVTWITTLPLALGLGAAIFWTLEHIGV